MWVDGVEVATHSGGCLPFEVDITEQVVAFGSMAPAMTQNPVERSKLATFRMYGAMLSMLAIAFVIAPQIRAAMGDPEALQQVLLYTTGGFLVLGMALYLFMVFNTKE